MFCFITDWTRGEQSNTLVGKYCIPALYLSQTALTVSKVKHLLRNSFTLSLYLSETYGEQSYTSVGE